MRNLETKIGDAKRSRPANHKSPNVRIQTICQSYPIKMVSSTRADTTSGAVAADFAALIAAALLLNINNKPMGELG